MENHGIKLDEGAFTFHGRIQHRGIYEINLQVVDTFDGKFDAIF